MKTVGKGFPRKRERKMGGSLREQHCLCSGIASHGQTWEFMFWVVNSNQRVKTSPSSYHVHDLFAELNKLRYA